MASEWRAQRTSARQITDFSISRTLASNVKVDATRRTLLLRTLLDETCAYQQQHKDLRAHVR